MTIKTSTPTVLVGLLKRKSEIMARISDTPEKQLAEVDAEIARAKTAAQLEAEQARAEKLKALYELHRAWKRKVVADAQTTIKHCQEEPISIVREIYALGGRTEPDNLHVLYEGALQVNDYCRRYDPELIGLPPPPSGAEAAAAAKRAAIREEEERIKRAEQQIATLEQMQKEHYVEIKPLVDGHKEAIKSSRQHIAELQRQK